MQQAGPTDDEQALQVTEGLGVNRRALQGIGVDNR